MLDDTLRPMVAALKVAITTGASVVANTAPTVASNANASVAPSSTQEALRNPPGASSGLLVAAGGADSASAPFPGKNSHSSASGRNFALTQANSPHSSGNQLHPLASS